MLRLGIISYLNTLPVYYAIEKGLVSLPPEVEVVKEVPSTLNRLLAKGELDIAVVSAFEYAKHYRRYLILPDLCIGAQREVMSVLFFSTVPIQELHQKEVYLTKASLTSKNLLIHLFRRMGIEPIYREFSMEDGIPENDYMGILLIGDDALRMLSRNRFRHVYDLARLWNERYHTPFVFALWCTRREAYRGNPRLVEECWRTLVRSREISHRLYRRIAEEKAAELGLGIKECLRYLNTLNFRLTRDYIKGLSIYFEKMYQEGLLDERPQLQFAFH